MRVCSASARSKGLLAFSLTVRMLDAPRPVSRVKQIKTRIATDTRVDAFQWALGVSDCYAVLAVADVVFDALV